MVGLSSHRLQEDLNPFKAAIPATDSATMPPRPLLDTIRVPVASTQIRDSSKAVRLRARTETHR
ncbi:hypothetical protein ESCO_003234 [Escovopsis weberi]|uniref:Uncharacterized protein n=1 Tax=Escovopsis weberi TaxID=150374 RepID=A0A0M9VT56_ESCWE|nr:hypothetical protein ESCO_003234 [Escovopsis weberi]